MLRKSIFYDKTLRQHNLKYVGAMGHKAAAIQNSHFCDINVVFFFLTHHFKRLDVLWQKLAFYIKNLWYCKLCNFTEKIQNTLVK